MLCCCTRCLGLRADNQSSQLFKNITRDFLNHQIQISDLKILHAMKNICLCNQFSWDFGCTLDFEIHSIYLGTGVTESGLDSVALRFYSTLAMFVPFNGNYKGDDVLLRNNSLFSQLLCVVTQGWEHWGGLVHPEYYHLARIQAVDFCGYACVRSQGQSRQHDTYSE